MILVALGANLSSPVGEPAATLDAALAELAASAITIEKRSGFYQSDAWPDCRDPPFVNAVVSVRTALAPSQLLAVLHDVEALFGRTRGKPNAPRTLDLDLIDYHGRTQKGPPELPHPRMASRRFVLVPLREVAPGWRHPVSGKTVDQLIAEAAPAKVKPLPRRG